MSGPTRKIGNTNVSAIGFGVMGLSAFYGNLSQTDEERFKILDAVYESGCTHWDTADVYGDNEELIGNWFKRTGRRNNVFLATKAGITLGQAKDVTADPEYIKAACDKSLRRLGVDKIDLYYLHRADPTVPIEKSVGAMAELVKEGKVKYIGLSEVSERTLRRAHAVHPIAALQVEYSPFCLDVERPDIGLLSACRELGIAVVAYSPLGRGLLTGRYTSPDDFEEGDFRLSIPKYGKDNFPNILKVVDEIKAVGAAHNAAASTTTLAWLLAQGEDVIPIPGTRSVKYLQENLAACNLRLEPKEIKALREIAERAEKNVKGDRYPRAGFMDFVYVDTPEL
ncbi:Aldo/keto reductase [Peniophora sp. CONT]|nr:Aldo/keto reductase [Peniophora sp. CONT]